MIYKRFPSRKPVFAFTSKTLCATLVLLLTYQENKTMAVQLTQGSAVEYENILYGNMSPKMAADYLREERISIRSFSDTLKRMYPHPDIIQRLKNFYRDNPLEGAEGKSSSMNRKIQNWVYGRNLPTNREDYFRIAFALALTEAQLNFLLGMCTDYAVQYRDGREVVLSWFLRNEHSYREAENFLSSLPQIWNCQNGNVLCSEAAEDGTNTPAGKAGNVSAASLSGMKSDHLNTHAHRSSLLPTGRDPRSRDYGYTGRGFTEASRITHEIRNEFQMVRDTEELRSCYIRNLDRFGQMHLRSYYYFRQYLKQLVQPLSVFGEDELDYSIETVMDTYLTLHMPHGKNRRNYSLVQKLIKQNWPNTTSIRSILSQTEDVPRKLLLLLYVVTENSDVRSGYRELDEDYVSLEEKVEDHWWTLNALLTECGMATLDLRNAFDWLIMYSISTDGEESMSERLEKVINELFMDVNS